jgi:hypothetical protein
LGREIAGGRAATNEGRGFPALEGLGYASVVPQGGTHEEERPTRKRGMVELQEKRVKSKRKS